MTMMIDDATADADDERCQLDYLTIQVLTEAIKCIDEEDESIRNVQMLAAVVIDPTHSDCIIRQTNGLFVWSERTITKLDETKGVNESLTDRQTRLVVGMLALMINLLMDTDTNLAQGCFLEPFMGSTFNLLKK